MKQSKSILLIEDDKDDQEFFIEALREIQNTSLYYVASNGKDAIDHLENSTTLPDLIFTDINMPVMGGIEYLTEAMKNPFTRNIPIFILSSSISYSEMALGLGAKIFIKKPGDPWKLKEQIEQIISLDWVNKLVIPTHTFQPVPPVHVN